MNGIHAVVLENSKILPQSIAMEDHNSSSQRYSHYMSSVEDGVVLVGGGELGGWGKESGVW